MLIKSLWSAHYLKSTIMRFLQFYYVFQGTYYHSNVSINMIHRAFEPVSEEGIQCGLLSHSVQRLGYF